MAEEPLEVPQGRRVVDVSKAPVRPRCGVGYVVLFLEHAGSDRRERMHGCTLNASGIQFRECYRLRVPAVGRRALANDELRERSARALEGVAIERKPGLACRREVAPVLALDGHRARFHDPRRVNGRRTQRRQREALAIVGDRSKAARRDFNFKLIFRAQLKTLMIENKASRIRIGRRKR